MPRFLMLACALVTGGCQWIPGTEANQAENAQKFVAQQLRDPASAQFRGMRIGHGRKPNDDPPSVVCGEVNAKNGMGGYAGFARFIADIDATDAMVDPQVTDGDRRHAAALELCSIRRDSVCADARKIADEIANQAGFNAMWENYCGSRA